MISHLINMKHWNGPHWSIWTKLTVTFRVSSDHTLNCSEKSSFQRKHEQRRDQKMTYASLWIYNSYCVQIVCIWSKKWLPRHHYSFFLRSALFLYTIIIPNWEILFSTHITHRCARTHTQRVYILVMTWHVWKSAYLSILTLQMCWRQILTCHRVWTTIHNDVCLLMLNRLGVQQVVVLNISVSSVITRRGRRRMRKWLEQQQQQQQQGEDRTWRCSYPHQKHQQLSGDY